MTTAHGRPRDLAPSTSASTPARVDLRSPLSLGTAFRFPLQSRDSRREVIVGALWLLVPVLGWILNMGHRIAMVRRMQHGLPAWPAWRDHRVLLRDGAYTLLGMAEYYAPALATGLTAWRLGIPWLWALAVPLFAAATIAIPGYMTVYCLTADPREILNPFRSLRRVAEAGPGYLHAWGITLAALGVSFSGLALLGVGFLATSVWFWQVAGFSFATVFTQRIAARPEAPRPSRRMP